jgi:hypothetical protein
MNQNPLLPSFLLVSCKVKEGKWCYTEFAARHPIKAKPVKTGDAKLWVYRHSVTTTARPPKINA